MKIELKHIIPDTASTEERHIAYITDFETNELYISEITKSVYDAIQYLEKELQAERIKALSQAEQADEFKYCPQCEKHFKCFYCGYDTSKTHNTNL